MIQEELEATPESGSSPKVDAAERDVARAHAKFSADLERVSYAGRKLTNKIVNSARPALVGVAVVTGVALIVAVLRSRRAHPQVSFLSAPRQASAWTGLARAALIALASSAGRHLAAKIIAVSQQRAAAALGQFEGGVNPRPPADS